MIFPMSLNILSIDKLPHRSLDFPTAVKFRPLEICRLMDV